MSALEKGTPVRIHSETDWLDGRRGTYHSEAEFSEDWHAVELVPGGGVYLRGDEFVPIDVEAER